MNTPIMLTPQQIVNIFLGICAGIITVSGAIIVLANIFKKLHSPEDTQNKRIANLEERMDEVDRKLDIDKKRLDNIEYGHEVTQEALLALLNYQLNPENKKPLEDAKQTLEKYLLRHREI